MFNPASHKKLIHTHWVIKERCVFGILFSSPSRDNFVWHTDGCIQIHHVLIDGYYAYDHDYAVNYVSPKGGKIWTHTVGMIRNKVVLPDSAFGDLISHFHSEKLVCMAFSFKIDFLYFDLHEVIWSSFMVYHTYYICFFQPDCLLIGLGQVTVVVYKAVPPVPVCLTTADVQKQRELGTSHLPII